jgi:Trypsin
MRRILLALVSAAMLAISLIAPATAITGDYVVDNDHPFVAMIAFYSDRRGTDDAFLHRCSGSLVDDGTPADGSRVVVTAGHCTDDGTGDAVAVSARLWFRQDAGTRFDGVNRDPLTGYPDKCIDDPNVALDACVTAHEMYNYGFDDFAGFPNNRDVGVIILDKPVVVPNGEYATITDAGAITSNKSVKLSVSGYGITEGHASSDDPLSFRVRLMAETTLVNTTNTNTAGFNLETQPNGGARGGTCSGDSGGPVFFPSASNVIVAVTSFGRTSPNECQGNDFSYRLDRQEVIDWIDEVAGDHWDQ